MVSRTFPRRIEAEPASELLRGPEGHSPATGLPQFVATRCDGTSLILSEGSYELYLFPQAWRRVGLIITRPSLIDTNRGCHTNWILLQYSLRWHDHLGNKFADLRSVVGLNSLIVDSATWYQQNYYQNPANFQKELRIL